MRIAIVGAAVSGLLVALLFKKRGFSVSIFEEKSIAEVSAGGMGLVLQQKFLEIVQKYQLFDLEQVSVSTQFRTYFDRDGKIVSRVPEFKKMSSRALLWQVIYGQIQDCPIHWKVDSTNINSDFDFILITDGLRSRVRKKLQPHQNIHAANYCAYRGSLDIDLVAIRELLDSFSFLPMQNEQIVFYPCPILENKTKKNILNWVWYRDGFDGDIAHTLKGLAGGQLAPQFAQIFEKSKNFQTADIVDSFSEKMVFGKWIMLGDAASTVRPHAGQSLNKLLIEAELLADCLLSGSGEKGQLLAWEKFCTANAKEVVAHGIKMASEFRTESRLLSRCAASDNRFV